nr:unnamed protein product [Callosobruchus analis]
MKSDLVELKNNLNDMKSSLPNTLIKLKSSLENLVDADDVVVDMGNPWSLSRTILLCLRKSARPLTWWIR